MLRDRLTSPKLGARRRARGVTLVEVLIVVALIALLSAGVVFGSGMLQSGRLRAAASLVISSVRVAASRANTTGRPVRIVFDMERHRVWIEESTSARMLREDDEAQTAGAEAATDAEQLARSEADRILEGPRAPRPRFAPLGKQVEGEETPGQELEPGIRLAMVQTEHDEQPVISERAYLYFWPGGRTENAVIQLSRGDDETFLTVRVSSLTGRARIEPGRHELPVSVLEGEYSEREEEP